MNIVLPIFFLLLFNITNFTWSSTPTSPFETNDEAPKRFSCGSTILPRFAKHSTRTLVDNDPDNTCHENDFRDSPYLSELTLCSARIAASTYTPTRMRLGVWQAHSFLYAMEMTSFNTNHNFKLSGLSPDTSYSVQLVGRTTAGRLVRSQMYFFKTPQQSIFTIGQ